MKHPIHSLRKDPLGTLLEPPVVIGASLVTAAALLKRSPENAARFAVAAPLANGISKLLKVVVDEPRPRVFDRRPLQSFPSGHSVAITALSVSAVAATKRWWLLPFAAAAIAAVNVARLRHREHWPRDVIAGDVVGLAGVAAGIGAAYAVQRLRERRRPSAETKQERSDQSSVKNR